jgi:hypothetical protein
MSLDVHKTKITRIDEEIGVLGYSIKMITPNQKRTTRHLYKSPHGTFRRQLRRTTIRKLTKIPDFNFNFNRLKWNLLRTGVCKVTDWCPIGIRSWAMPQVFGTYRKNLRVTRTFYLPSHFVEGFVGHPRPKAPKGRQGSPSGGSSRGHLTARSYSPLHNV